MGPFLMCVYFICVVIIFLGPIFWPKRRQWLVTRKLPGPQSLPFLGSLHLIIGNRHHSFLTFVKFITEHGKLFRVWFGPKLFIVLSDPVDIQTVLGDSKIKNRDYISTEGLVPFFGHGLLTSRDDMWKMHRKLLTPMFHFQVLNTYVDVFGRKAMNLCDTLDEFADGRCIDIHKYVSMCTMDAICETAIGTSLDVRTGGGMDFYNGILSALDLIHNRAVRPWLMLRWLYPLTSDGRKAAKFNKKIIGFTDSIVATKLTEYRTQKESTANAAPKDTDQSQKKIKTLLELLIETSETEGSLLTVQEMRDELTTIAAAGFDTTALTISNLFIMIGLNPVVQEEIVKEQDRIFNGDLRSATIDDINKMEYLDRAFKETLRLLPVAPLLVREISKDVVLQCGQIVPAGSSTCTFSYMVHRDPRYFPEPERFEPDRWLPDPSRTSSRHPFAYLPFGAGPRNCIGQKYGVLQMKSVASILLRKFVVSHNFTEKDLMNIDVSTATRLSAKYEIKLAKRMPRLYD